MIVVEGSVDNALTAVPYSHLLRTARCVEMDTWLPSGDFVWTYSVNTCMLLVAHNTETNQGLLGHFLQVSHDRRAVPRRYPVGLSQAGSFESALARIAGLGSRTATSVVLAGAGIEYYGTEHDYVEDERAYALGRVAWLGLSEDDIEIIWSEEPNTSIDAHLDCHSGTLTIERHHL